MRIPRLFLIPTILLTSCSGEKDVCYNNNGPFYYNSDNEKLKIDWEGGDSVRLYFSESNDGKIAESRSIRVRRVDGLLVVGSMFVIPDDVDLKEWNFGKIECKKVGSFNEKSEFKALCLNKITMQKLLFRYDNRIGVTFIDNDGNLKEDFGTDLFLKSEFGFASRETC